MNRDTKPLYRKMNTRARGVRHNFGGDFKYSRHKKRDSLEQVKGSMGGEKERGLDYTPLFKFLLSKEGEDWDRVFSEASSRLDKLEPIYWMVSLNEKKDYVRIGESTYFSGMYVDEDRKLRLVNPHLTVNDMIAFCDCCTHTLNGKVFGNKKTKHSKS